MTRGSRIAVYTAFGMTCAAAIGLVIWGVLTHQEEGFLDVCWVDQQAAYTNELTGVQITELCNGAPVETLAWPRKRALQISTVARRAQPATRKQVAMVRNILKELNHELGWELLVYTEDPFTSDVHIEWGHDDIAQDGGRELGGCSHARFSEATIHGLIRLRSIPLESIAYNVVMHEIAHCALLLAHDPQSGALMYIDGGRGKQNKFAPTLSSHDIKLIQKSYGRN